MIIIKQTMSGGGYFKGQIKIDRKGIYRDAELIARGWASVEDAAVAVAKIKAIRPTYQLSIHTV